MSTTVQIPTVQDIYRIAYIVNCGWGPGHDGGWVHPQRKMFKHLFDPTDLEDFVLSEDWPLEEAFWQAYGERNEK